MKALTIEELQQLDLGDWVYIIEIKYQTGFYLRKDVLSNEIFNQGNWQSLYYSEYNKTWVAYKNKEQVGCKGELVEFPRMFEIIKGCEWRLEYNVKSSGVECIIQFYGTKEECEQKLKELTTKKETINGIINVTRKVDGIFTDLDDFGCYAKGIAIDRLAELEDMIEQGKLVEKIEPKTEMTKEQQIEEMAEIIDNRILEANLWIGSMNRGKGYWIAEDLINKGYRKQEEIEKQVAKEIFQDIYQKLAINYVDDGYQDEYIDTACLYEDLEDIANKYGVKVE